jgi:hypothetical protein
MHHFSQFSQVVYVELRFAILSPLLCSATITKGDAARSTFQYFYVINVNVNVFIPDLQPQKCCSTKLWKRSCIESEQIICIHLELFNTKLIFFIADVRIVESRNKIELYSLRYTLPILFIYCLFGRLLNTIK